MSVSSIGAQSQLAIQQLMQMRAQFDDLQRQLSSGQKSATYAGLGLDRGITVSLNAQMSAIGGFNDTIDNVRASINVTSNVVLPKPPPPCRAMSKIRAAPRFPMRRSRSRI